MAPIDGVNKGCSLIARIVFFFAKRRVGKIPNPIRIMALNSPILRGYGLWNKHRRAQEKYHIQLRCWLI